jgi:hypothetical protein
MLMLLPLIFKIWEFWNFGIMDFAKIWEFGNILAFWNFEINFI